MCATYSKGRKKMSHIIDNPNSPENLLGKWFEEIEHYESSHNLIGTDQESVIARGSLSHILDFSDKNNKLIEMYNWLISDEGLSFLKINSRPSEFVYYEIQDLSQNINWGNFISVEDTDGISEVREWVQSYECMLPVYLTLK
jgi:hypothetical protein